MRKIVTIILLASFVLSCGGGQKKSVEAIIESGDLESMRAKRSELVIQQQNISNQLQELDKAIGALDTIKKLPLVTTITAKDTVFKHYLELQGSVTTKEMVTIYPEFSGTLTQVLVKEGQKVAKGQILAKIDDGGLSQQLAQLKIQADLAKTTFERQQRLWEQKIGSEIQYLQAKSNFEAQQEAVKQMQSQLEKTIVRAPFSGVIDDVITERGTVVAPGTPLMLLVNLNNMYIEADVPEKYITSVTPGKEAKVYFPILSETITTTVRQVGNYIKPNNRSFRAEVGIPNTNNKVKPNLTAKVHINDYTNPNAILLPQSIISENANGQQYVYVVTNTNGNNEAVAKRTYIKTGKIQGDFVEIVEGLSNGDLIIEEGARSVQDGQKVKILN